MHNTVGLWNLPENYFLYLAQIISARKKSSEGKRLASDLELRRAGSGVLKNKTHVPYNSCV
jgi:hypothetical protein